MSMEAVRHTPNTSAFEQLRMARDILRDEGRAILKLADHLQGEFCEALALLSGCNGSVLVTGMGKAGLIGQKIAATLASTGTSSHFLHPGEAVHGDLGRVQPQDVVLALSFSGETEEITRLLESLTARQTPLIAITSSATSTLGQAAQVTLVLGTLQEACPLGLAPSTSTTAMLALGDALALVLSHCKGFKAADFARHHPGGSLGRKLARVEEVMRPLGECRVACHTQTVRQVLVHVSRPGRRTGAIMLIDDQARLVGLFTDSDLARMLEHGCESALDDSIALVMTHNPKTVSPSALLPQAIDLMADRKISELPVVDDQGEPLGLIDITDLLEAQPSGREHSGASTVRSPHSHSEASATIRFPKS